MMDLQPMLHEARQRAEKAEAEVERLTELHAGCNARHAYCAGREADMRRLVRALDRILKTALPIMEEDTEAFAEGRRVLEEVGN
jgi:hypothetical protein